MRQPERRSRRHKLHNFSLPPLLKWGNQRLLRCTNFPTTPHNLLRLPPSPSFLHHRSPAPARHPIGTTTPKKTQFPDTGIEAVRQKLTLDLRVDVENIMKVSSSMMMMIPTGGERVVSTQEEDDLAIAMAMARPWNLRTRRAACKSPVAVRSNGIASGRFRGFGTAAAGIDNGVEEEEEEKKEKRKEKLKFSISISKEEVEDDFLAMFGMRPPRRPKKRPKVVQRQLDLMFPGLWLTEVTQESYKVHDIPES